LRDRTAVDAWRPLGNRRDDAIGHALEAKLSCFG
jgi:hypothetical protein